MKNIAAAVAAFTIQATASPLAARQHLDLAIVSAAPKPTIASVPVGASTQVVAYNLAAATEAATATALPVQAAEPGKRSLRRRAACDPQPAGAGPVPSPDTPTAFLTDDTLASTANNVRTPIGYHNTFRNLQGSCSTLGYLGYTALGSYDPEKCASRCIDITGCMGFNIFFERDPTVEPGDGCPNPASTNVIKCSFWGGDVSPSCATNTGQSREQFQVVIAGSNGYMTSSVPPVEGYTGTFLGDASINAPLGCNDQDTYMGFKIFTDGPFNPGLCAAACESQNEYNLAHPPASGDPMICRFFNTYMLAENGDPRGQVCAMYSNTWDSSYAVNYVSVFPACEFAYLDR